MRDVKPQSARRMLEAGYACALHRESHKTVQRTLMEPAGCPKPKEKRPWLASTGRYDGLRQRITINSHNEQGCALEFFVHLLEGLPA